MRLFALRSHSSRSLSSWCLPALLLAAACSGGGGNATSEPQPTASAGGTQPAPATTTPDASAAAPAAEPDAGSAMQAGATEPASTTVDPASTTASTDPDAGASGVPAERPWESASPEIVARIQPLYPQFRRCFAAARDVATATGSSFVLNLDVEPRGRVREVHALFTANVPEARARGVIRCLEARARTLTFAATEQGSRTQSLHSVESAPTR